MASNDRNPGLGSARSAPEGHRVPSHDQQQILDRIALQRERLSARRAARAQAVAAAQAPEGPDGGDSLASRALAFAREHPVAVAAAAGIALMAGPGRLIKWASVLLPIVMRYTSR
ncbi:hypothetical protein [Acidovorax sp. RAC01]|uniref:hypothetical protein n=1 Tax=Acidovorax sp. RAC01 TaxID=1842533 RepID=UPI00083E748B|nr:hypothetical protein [Acidovorax sp. RAC01]AOG24116.1 hypothetical protein BSY15_3645 [Acidovorax sp. RAC01]